jgi:excisionase family DNA binding protein
MGAIGNLNDYVKFQMAEGMAKGGAGPAGAAAEIAMGFGMAQNMMAQGAFNMNPAAGAATPPPLPGAAAPAAAPSVDILTPAQVAQTLGVTEADVLASIEGGQIKAKKIGTQYRITKAALDEFLAQ